MRSFGPIAVITASMGACSLLVDDDLSGSQAPPAGQDGGDEAAVAGDRAAADASDASTAPSTITFVGSISAQAPSTVDLVFTPPGGAKADDLLLAVVHLDGANGEVTKPPEWIEIGAHTAGVSGSAVATYWAAYHRLLASESETTAFTFKSPTVAKRRVQLVAFRGTRAVQPVTPGVIERTNAASTSNFVTLSGNSITTVAPSLPVYFFGIAGNAAYTEIAGLTRTEVGPNLAFYRAAELVPAATTLKSPDLVIEYVHGCEFSVVGSFALALAE